MPTPSTADRAARTEAARIAQMRNAALRAVDDPVKLARAARIVRAGLARNVLTEDDLRGDVIQPGDLADMGGVAE